MKITIVSGSPRKKMNSENIQEKAAFLLKEKNFEIETIKISNIDIMPCIHCNHCASHDECIQDEKTNEINSILKKSDAIIIISPVYFGSIPSQLKALLDRTLPLRRNGFALKGKPGAVITTGGSRNGGQELAIQSVHAWMLIHGMIIVGDNSHFGGIFHSAEEDDNIGGDTLKGTTEAITNLLLKFK